MMRDVKQCFLPPHDLSVSRLEVIDREGEMREREAWRINVTIPCQNENALSFLFCVHLQCDKPSFGIMFVNKPNGKNESDLR